jgi:protein TonB
MKDDPLGLSFLASIFIHGAALILASIILKHTISLQRQDLLPISLVDLPRNEEPKPIEKIKTPPEIKKPPAPAKLEKPKELKPLAKSETFQPKPAPPQPTVLSKEEPLKPAEDRPPPATSDAPPPLSLGAKVESGGSKAGAGNLFAKGEIAVVPGSGTAGGGGGTATAGLGRGSTDPGRPAITTPLKTNREAKPIQTVRAVYPPLALRMGMEGDVTLKIAVDTEGKVTKAEIIKSGGAGFDEEALRAVKQSRFEPAQRDGQNVPAEFTYVYRFRLQR